MVQPVSVRILLTIAAKYGLKVVSRDVGNAFPHAEPLEKVCTVAGPEFGEREGCLAEIVRNMHGMASASRAFSLFFGDFTHSLGFVPTRADQDIWIKSEDDGKLYQYTSTHVDDFLIIGKNPMKLMDDFIKNFDIHHVEEKPATYLGSQ